MKRKKKRIERETDSQYVEEVIDVERERERERRVFQERKEKKN